MGKDITRSYISGWVIALIVVALSGNAAIAETVVFAAGPVYGGQGAASGGGVANCRVFNFGSQATISSRKIFSNTNVSVAIVSDTCTEPLGAKKYCYFSHSITANLAFTCHITVTATNVKISGGIDITDQIGEVVPVVSAPFTR